VRIDSFVFNPEESTSRKALQVTRGVFRYVSGYAAGDQETRIAMPSGALAIRGSVAAGIVAPDVPDFVYVGEGAASFANPAGSTELQAGTAIAVPSPSTVPMPAAAMPAAVAAQALQAIERRLPPRAARRSAASGEEAWLRRAGAANLVPAAEQARRETASARSRSLPNPAARGSIAGEVGLLVDGNRFDLFRAGPRTAEQTAFIANSQRANPSAAAYLSRARAQAGALHNATRASATAAVIRGVARAAPSAEIVRRVVAASVRANPAAASAINRHAADAARKPDRREPARHDRRAGEPHRAPPARHEAPPREKTPAKHPRDEQQQQR